MSKSIFAKAAAVVCGAATLCALSVCASATEFSPVDNASKYTGIDTTKVNAVAGIVEIDEADLASADVDAATDGIQIKYPVYVVNNSEGFGGIGFNIFIPTDLKVITKDATTPQAKKGLCAAGSASFVYNEETSEGIPLVGVGYMTDETVTDSGEFYNITITLPAGAKAGDKWDITTKIDEINDADNNPLTTGNPVAGYIAITGSAPAVTTTPAPAVSTTPAPAADTTPAPAADTTPAPAVGTTTAAGASDGTTTTAESTSDNAAAGTTTGKGNSNNNNSNNNNNNNSNGSKTDATKTGDAGVGVAAAALLLAAGTAVVATKKKKD